MPFIRQFIATAISACVMAGTALAGDMLTVEGVADAPRRPYEVLRWAWEDVNTAGEASSVVVVLRRDLSADHFEKWRRGNTVIPLITLTVSENGRSTSYRLERSTIARVNAGAGADNADDGAADSIWIDIGAPIMTHRNRN